MLSISGRELLTPAERQTRPGSGVAMSVIVHAALVALVLYLNGVGQPRTPQAVTRLTPRLVAVVYVAPTPLELPAMPAPVLAPPAKVDVRTETPRPEIPTPLPPRPIENRVAAVAPPPEARPVEALPKPAPPKPAPPEVVVGAFANNAVVRTAEPNREIERVAFDAPSPKATQPKAQTTTLGGFDRPADPKPASPRQADAVVAETAFGRAPAAAPPAPAARTVRETGFGDSLSRENPRTAEKQPPAVTSSGFSSAREVQVAAKTTAPPPARIIPVEVLSKPNPAYTDEARKLKIEGEVLLEVDFAATGNLTVVRVVRGLGYGLDEAAIRAAQQIKFKPAQDGGRAVDFRATVQIVFRLA